MLPTIKTEQIGSTWFAEVQFQLFTDDPASTWIHGPKGMGDTPEEAIKDAAKKTSAGLYQATSRLRASLPS